MGGLCGGGGVGGGGDYSVLNWLLVWFVSTGYLSSNTTNLPSLPDINQTLLYDIRRYIYLEYTTAVIIVNGLVV